MFARLTETNGTYGLPVIDVHRAKAVEVGGGDSMVQYPKGIFTGPTAWSDAELNAIGYARFDEVKPGAGELSSGTVDDFTNGKVTRTHTTVPDPNYLDRRKTEVKRNIKGQRDYVRDAGIEHTIDTVTYVVQTDGDSRRELIGAIVGLNERGNPNATQKWRMLSNAVVDIAMSDFKAMALAVRDHVDACYTHQAVLEAAVNAAVNLTELEAIDITTGWPSHYIAPEPV